MTGLTRRRLLAGSGATLAVALAGCSDGATDDDPEDGTDNENEDEGEPAETDTESETESPDETADDADNQETVLGGISIENVHSEAHTVDIIVEFDGEIEHWTTHELEAGDGTTLEQDWPSDPGSFRVLARLDDDELTQVEPAQWNGQDCLSLFALVNRNGELTMLGDTDGGHCGDGDAAFDEPEE
ncbi:hypothetical protein [Natronolimnobius baerhuensis]|uniref:Uncharacterized protein n=1 Tax=Natronolimnobius baerhuensis TaxID=253108 RepID=A0A202E5W9_9EURY|nr:hypothetical protein [Natronolimnobius baerhuensis]OVE83651.1 hypothetical protein B2G88_14570 [Natronolimnobius baerhuensis]